MGEKPPVEGERAIFLYVLEIAVTKRFPFLFFRMECFKNPCEVHKHAYA